MIKNITASALLVIIGISLGVYFNENNNSTLNINNLTEAKKNTLITNQIDNAIDKNSSPNSMVVNTISIQDMKSSLRDVISEFILKYENNHISFNEQQQYSIKNEKPVLDAAQLQQQQDDIELARSYIINAISNGAWSNSDVTHFNMLSSKIPTAELTKILSPFYIAINKGLITPAKNVMLF